jgi:hypothetical protein
MILLVVGIVAAIIYVLRLPRWRWYGAQANALAPLEKSGSAQGEIDTEEFTSRKKAPFRSGVIVLASR